MRVAIIPARGGSRRIPRKNIKDFHGKPIIAYSIETAKAAFLFELIIVSTEDQEIANVSSEYGARVFMREKHLANDTIGTQEVVRDALRYLNGATEVCCIYPTAPLMTAKDLQIGLNLMDGSHQAYTYTVGPDINGETKDAGQWYWGRANAFTAGLPLEGNSNHYMLPAERCCDINTPEDWLRAERMYGEMYGWQQ